VVLKFRTVRRACLALLALVLIVPTALVVGLTLYTRGPAYRRRVAGDLSAALGLPVSIGRVERVRWAGLKLIDVSIGGSSDAQLLTAKWASLQRDESGLHDVTLMQAHLAVRSRQGLTDLLSLPARARDAGRLAALRMPLATFEWTIDGSLDADGASASLAFAPPPEPGEATLTLTLRGNPVCRVRWSGQRTGPVTVAFDDVPARAVQMAGLLTELRVGEAVASGGLVVPEAGSDRPAHLDLTFDGLPLGPLAERWGVPGLTAVACGRMTAQMPERGAIRLTHLDARGPGVSAGWITTRALRRLGRLVQADLADLPDTADSVRLTRFAVSAAREGDSVRFTGALEPAGTVLKGELAGDTAPRVLLRLRRTVLTLDELARRLAEVRAGDVERVRRPTTTRATSRPAP